MSMHKNLLIPAALLTLSVTQAVSASVVASAYTLNPPVTNLDATSPNTTSISVPTVTLGKNAFNIYPTNSAGQAVIVENGTSTKAAYLLDPTNISAGLTRIDPTSLTANSTTFALTYSNIQSITAQGVVTGSSSNGTNSAGWIYTPGTSGSAGTTTVLALTGALNATPYYYQNPTTLAYTFAQSAIAAGGTGWTVGTATRYSGLSNSSTIGGDVWLQNPSTIGSGPIIIPLINSTDYYETLTLAAGATTNTYEFSSVFGVNASGTAVGTSSRTLGVSTGSGSTVNYGADAWMYTGGAATPTTTQIGLIGTSTGSYELTSTYTPTSPATGPHAYQQSSVASINTAGQVLGTSTIYATGTTSSNGTLGWIYTPSSTPASGTPATATYDASLQTFVNGATLTTTYGSYQQVGLTDSTHLKLGNPNTSVTAINDKGQAIGSSTLYVGTSSVGSDLWYYSGVSGAASVNISPISSNTAKYSYGGYSAQFKSLSAVSFNSNGLVAGTVSRYVPTTTSGTGLGTDSFVYDPTVGTNGTTFVVDLPDGATTPTGATNSVGNYQSATIKYLSDSGIAIGTYNTYTGTTSSTISGMYLFAWYEDGSATGKFVTLNSELTDTNFALGNTSATDPNWSAIANLLTIGSDGTLYGTGTTSASTTPASTPAIFTLTPTPEPTSLGLAGVGSLILLARRRSRN